MTDNGDGKKNPLSIPRQICKRYFRRAGCLRISDGAIDALDKRAQRRLDRLVSLAARKASLEGRRTILLRDVETAMKICGIQIY